MSVTDTPTDNQEELAAPAQLQEQQNVPSYDDPDYPNEKGWNLDLPDQLVKVLSSLGMKVNKRDMFDRRRELIRDRRNRFYEDGYQHIYETRNGSFTMAAPGASVYSEGANYTCSEYIDDFNITAPFCRIIYALQTQEPPGIDFQPKDPSRAEDNEAADSAEIFRHYYDRENPIKEWQMKVVRMMTLSGRIVGWTRNETDVEKWGYLPTGDPKVCTTTSIYGTLESKVPITAKDQKGCSYCVLSDDPEVISAKYLYPKFRSKIKDGMSGLGDMSYERIARLGVLNGNKSYAQIGETLTYLTTRSHFFLRPSNFEDDSCDVPLEEPFQFGEAETVREALHILFPVGICMRFIGDVYTGARNCSLDDEIKISHPAPGDGMNRKALIDPFIVVQDRFNDNMNIATQIWEHGFPSTWVNADDQEYAAIERQRADPFSIRQKKVKGVGNKTADDFFREPNPELPETFVGFIDNLSGPLGQFIMSTPPALFGAAMEDQKTASGYAQARVEAMGTQGVTWNAIEDFWATVYSQAAILAAKNPQNDAMIAVPIPGSPGQTASLSLDKLTKGKFGAYPDCDSSAPETTVQKRQTVTQLVTMAAQSPTGAQIFEEPDSWVLIKKYMGVPELVLPQAEAATKQMFEIEELLLSAPIPPDPMVLRQAMAQHAQQAIIAQTMGGPAPQPFDPDQFLTPSVPVQDLDYHQWEFAKCQSWLSSGACRKEQAKGNQPGILNVIAHAKQHQAKLAVMMAQMQASMQPAAPPKAAPQKPGNPPNGQPKPPSAGTPGGAPTPATPGGPTPGSPTM